MAEEKTKKDLKEQVVEKETEDITVGDVKEISPKAAEKIEEQEKPTAKAGKRSAKALREKEEEQAKEERKATSDDEEKSKPKGAAPKTRSRLERRSKGYRKSAEAIEKGNKYELKEGVELATKTSHVNFDATVELHVRLNVDPKQADQNIRDTVVLPEGTGKDIRVAVFADADQAKEAKKAGADIAASDEFLQQLEKGTIDFDVLISTPQMMTKLGKYARVLGPKGLMPNPKSGTVTTDVAKAVEEAKAGKLEYRVDSAGIVHVGIGKVSFGADKLMKNANAILSSIRSNKPGSIKGNYVRSVYLTTSMGPSVKLTESVV